MANSTFGMFTPHHLGIVVSDLTAAMNAYIANLGYTFFQFEVNEGNASLNGSSAKFALRFGLGQLGLGLIELIQPVSGITLYSQHLAQKGPGLHHLGLSTTDLPAARQQFADCGYACLQNGTISDLVDFSYYDAANLGCIVEPLQLSCDMGAYLLANAQPYTLPGYPAGKEAT